MRKTIDVFDEYGNYKYPDYSNSQYTHDVSTTGGAMIGMTIAIKDFEMPPSCYNCNFCLRRRTSDYGYFGMCDLTNEEGINLYEHSRSEDCPLVEAIPKADYEARLKADMGAMLEELKKEIVKMKSYESPDGQDLVMLADIGILFQQKIDLLQKQGTDNCDNCFNGTTKGGCAVKELMKNKDCKYYMPRKKSMS